MTNFVKILPQWPEVHIIVTRPPTDEIEFKQYTDTFSKLYDLNPNPQFNLRIDLTQLSGMPMKWVNKQIQFMKSQEEYTIHKISHVNVDVSSEVVALLMKFIFFMKPPVVPMNVNRIDITIPPIA